MKDARSSLLVVAGVSISVAFGVWQAHARAAGPGDPQFIPTGVTITPNAAPGSRFDSLNPDVPDDPAFTADHAVSMAVSPDKKTLLILTSGPARTSSAERSSRRRTRPSTWFGPSSTSWASSTSTSTSRRRNR